MLILMFSLLLFALVTVSAYTIWSRVFEAKDPVTLRLRRLRASHGAVVTNGFGERPPILIGLAARLGGFVPARDGRDALRTGLVCAGFRRPDAPLVFLGTKLLLAAALPLLWIGLGAVAARPFKDIAAWTMVAAGVGFYLPTLYLTLRVRQRQTEILSALPDALDLMVVCVEAGLGIAGALQRVAAEFRLASPTLSDELSGVHQEMQTGVPRTDAMRNLARRTGVDEVYSLVAMLVQTDRLGTSVAMALRTHAGSMRTRRRQRAEKLARKAAVKLAFPLVFLILPALLTIILGPAAIELIKTLTAFE